MNSQRQSKAQRKANTRNQLFRQLHGYSLKPFIDRAKRENAITSEEIELLDKIQEVLSVLKQKQFDNSKKVGLNPRRRCFCNGIARWICTSPDGYTRYLCNKHKEEWEKDNVFLSFKSIDPYK